MSHSIPRGASQVGVGSGGVISSGAGNAGVARWACQTHRAVVVRPVPSRT